MVASTLRLALPVAVGLFFELPSTALAGPLTTNATNNMTNNSMDIIQNATQNVTDVNATSNVTVGSNVTNKEEVVDNGPVWTATGDCTVAAKDKECVVATDCFGTCRLTLERDMWFVVGNIPSHEVHWVDGWGLDYNGTGELFNYFQPVNSTIVWKGDSVDCGAKGWEICASREAGKTIGNNALTVDSPAQGGKMMSIVIAVAVVVVVVLALCICACCICRCCRKRRDAKLSKAEKEANESDASTLDSEVSDATERV